MRIIFSFQGWEEGLLRYSILSKVWESVSGLGLGAPGRKLYRVAFAVQADRQFVISFIEHGRGRDGGRRAHNDRKFLL